jgi:hypothetical protein
MDPPPRLRCGDLPVAFTAPLADRVRPRKPARRVDGLAARDAPREAEVEGRRHQRTIHTMSRTSV